MKRYNLFRKRKTIPIMILILCLTLVGCSSGEGANATDAVGQNDVQLQPPTPVEQPVESGLTEEEKAKVNEELKQLQITDRTKIMVSEDNVDTFNKQEVENPELTEEVIEENSTLTRFKQNQSNISFPRNYKISGEARVDELKTTNINLSRLEDGSVYASYDYSGIHLEEFIVDDTLNQKEVYIMASNSGEEIDGKATTYSACQIITYSDFKVFGVEQAVKLGNNYRLTASYIVDGEQVDGELIVGDNMTVYNMTYVINGVEYDLKVQTLLKIPKTVDDFRPLDVTDDEMAKYSQWLYNAFRLTDSEVSELPSTEEGSMGAESESSSTVSMSIPAGYVSVDDNVDVKLDDKGNITAIHVQKIYLYSDGNTITHTIIKDAAGNILDEQYTSTANPTGTVQEAESTEVVPGILKPTIKLDENNSADTLRSALNLEMVTYDANLGFAYVVVPHEDPTMWAINVTFKNEQDKATVESLINKFVENNATVVVEWRE